MMYREDSPTSGDIIVNGINLATLRRKRIPYLRRKIGVVFQDFKLLSKLTVYENVAYALEVIEEPANQIREKVNDVLALVGLTQKARMFPNELSGGEQQRVSIARSIVNVPDIVIADEPTGNLDTKTSMEVMELLVKLFQEKGTTFLLVSHDKITQKYTKRTINLLDGKISTII